MVLQGWWVAEKQGLVAAVNLPCRYISNLSEQLAGFRNTHRANESFGDIAQLVRAQHS